MRTRRRLPRRRAPCRGPSAIPCPAARIGRLADHPALIAAADRSGAQDPPRSVDQQLGAGQHRALQPSRCGTRALGRYVGLGGRAAETRRRGRSLQARAWPASRAPDPVSFKHLLLRQAGSALWIAGQIPLVPGTMEVASPAGRTTWELTARHAWTVLARMGPASGRLLLGAAWLATPALAGYRPWWSAVWSAIAPVRTVRPPRSPPPTSSILIRGVPVGGLGRPSRRRSWSWPSATRCRAVRMSRWPGSQRATIGSRRPTTTPPAMTTTTLPSRPPTPPACGRRRAHAVVRAGVFVQRGAGRRGTLTDVSCAP